MVASSLRVEGADQFFALARRLKEAGDKDLQRELYRGLNRAVKPLTASVRQSALETLPSQGGLNVTIATGSKVKVQRRTGARSVGIKLIATAQTPKGRDRDLAGMDKGKLRHPLFGNRGFWYPQAIAPGWWTKPTGRAGPVVRAELLKVMEEVRRKIEG